MVVCVRGCVCVLVCDVWVWVCVWYIRVCGMWYVCVCFVCVRACMCGWVGGRACVCVGVCAPRQRAQTGWVVGPAARVEDHRPLPEIRVGVQRRQQHRHSRASRDDDGRGARLERRWEGSGRSMKGGGEAVGGQGTAVKEGSGRSRKGSGEKQWTVKEICGKAAAGQGKAAERQQNAKERQQNAKERQCQTDLGRELDRAAGLAHHLP